MARRKAASDSPQPAKRTRVAETKFDKSPTAKDAPGTKASAASMSPSPTLRRARPRRTAAVKSAAATAALAAKDGASAAVPLRDSIHEKLFSPITDDEIKEWQGWSEIESEPAFFNFILSELGVQDAAIHELFSVDEASMRFVPDPLGLIFLYRFVEEDEDEVREDCPENLWFANQTTSNACGTIAMLNIAMNCDRIRLGDHLTRFKAATQHLHPALRGHLLSADATIRSKHNSFARRLDMLMSDLALKLEWVEDNQKKKRRAGTKKKTKKDAEEEAGFHFIAYVPMGSDVWELNGMQEKPLKLGSFDGDWTAMARERIATRMAAYDHDTAVFSLLALCYTPKTGEEREGNASTGTSAGDNDSDIRRAAARKGDYTPAVHCWLKKLADKGVLRRLATGEAGEADETDEIDEVGEVKKADEAEEADELG